MASDGSISLICDVLLILVFLIATALNSLVLLVFYRKPALRTLSNRFVINLLATNLLSCWLLLPMILVDSMLTPPWNICAVNQGISTGLCAASVLAVLLIGIDQYYAVVDPLHYHSHINNTRCAFMITSSWCFSFLCAAAGGLLLGDREGVWGSCSKTPPVFSFITDTYVSVFSVTYSVLTFFLPFSVICWMYMSIYFAAHKNSQRTRRNGSSTGFYSNTVNSSVPPPPVSYAVVPIPRTSSASESPKLSAKSVDVSDPAVFVKPAMSRSSTRTSLRSTSSFIVNSLRYRISNASMFRYREETRAARISALVIVMGLVCWCPYSLVMLLGSPMIGVRVSYTVAKLSVTLLIIATVLSPLLFAHRNRRIQRDLRKLFGLCPRDGTPAHRPTKRVLQPDHTRTALDLLAEGGDEPHDNSKTSSFLSRVWWGEGAQIVTKLDKVSGESLICMPEVAFDVENGRSSFSSGGSMSTQRSTSAASISTYTGDEC